MLDRTSMLSPAQRIMDEECVKAGLTVTSLRMDIRVAKYTDARRQIACRMRKELKLPYEVIGRMLHRDQSSIQNLVKDISKNHHRETYVPVALREERI